MEWNKGPGYFSSYIHFEATGDSEVDCDHVMGEEHACDQLARSVYDGDDDDDALSCSYEGSCACSDQHHESCCDEHDDGEEKEELEDVVYGRSYCCEDDEMQEHHKSYVSFDSGHEVVDEMEKNRLFWEACLAS